MKLSVRPLESVLKGGEGSSGLVLAPVRCWCQMWLLEASFQWRVPETGLACRMGAWESSARLPWGLAQSGHAGGKARGPSHL